MKRISGMSDYARAIAKLHLVSGGAGYEELDRPIIGVVNSWNEIAPGHVPLREVAGWVKEGVREAGGLPLEFGTIALCDGIAQGHRGMRYALPSRDLIADSIEAMVLGHDLFDGLVFVTACDKITPGMLLAAARLDLPALFVTGGPANTTVRAERKKEIRRRFRDGEIGEREFITGSLDFYCGPGICPYLGTANTMLMVVEALGLMLPYSSTLPWGAPERETASRRAGARAVEVVREDLRPAALLTRAAFLNAVRLVAAVGGSLNTLLHLPAAAAEAGTVLSWDDFDRESRAVPFLTPVTPNGPYSVPDLHRAGGVPAVLRRLTPFLDLSTRNVSGETTGEIVAQAEVVGSEVIRPADDPVQPEGGIAILKGNLAPGGAVVKQSAVPADLQVFAGPARVFDSEEECLAALAAGRLGEGDVVIIRYEGPRGGPGMREMHRLTELLGRFRRVAVVTDGRFSGASAGLSVGYLRPEAYDGGPLAFVADGDPVVIDVPQRRLSLGVSDQELAARRPGWKALEKPASRLLQAYRDSAPPDY